MKNAIITLLFSIMLIACNNQKAKFNGEVIKLDAEKVVDLTLSTVIDDFRYIKLSNSNAYIGDIEKILVKGDRIYILDARSSVALYVFDKSGELEFKIANYGRGPGEFMGPYDFTIDEKNGEIIIYDARAMKLCYYKVENGDFLREENIEFRFGRFTSADSNLIFFLNNMPYKTNHNTLVTDSDINIIGKSMELNSNMIGYFYSLPMNFSKQDGEIYFTAPSDYFVYKYDSEIKQLNKYIFIDFGDNALPTSYYEEHPNNQSRRDEIGSSAYHISNYFESDTFRFFRYRKGELGSHYFLESKVTANLIHTSYERMHDDLEIGPLPRWPMAITDDYLIWYEQPTKMISFIEQKKKNLGEKEWEEFKVVNKELVNFAESLSKDDNPYLILTEIDF